MGFEFKKSEKVEPLEREEKLSLTALKKQLNDLLVAKDAGFLIPQPMIDLVEEQIRIRRGVQSVYICPNSKCKQKYESFVRIKSLGCQCGYVSKQVWENPEIKARSA